LKQVEIVRRTVRAMLAVLHALAHERALTRS
jgi:hypothetical protein